MLPCLAAPCNISPYSPKYVTLRPVIDFFGGKKCQAAALISPSKRQKRHRGPDRPKIRPSQQRSESRQFKLSQFQSPLASIYPKYKISFWPGQYSETSNTLMKVPIWILGKSLGSLKTFNSFVSGWANINVYPSLERVLYLFVYDRLTWLSRLEPAL